MDELTAEQRAARIVTRCWSGDKILEDNGQQRFAGLNVEIAQAIREAEVAAKRRGAEAARAEAGSILETAADNLDRHNHCADGNGLRLLARRIRARGETKGG